MTTKTIKRVDESKSWMFLECPDHGHTFFQWFEDTNTGYCIRCANES